MSIIVVTHDNLVFTRLCLETVIVNTERSDVEIIVVDNASSDLTPTYLESLAQRSPRVRVLRNERNLGFAPAVNQGLARARGDVLVILNNDTMVAPGWLDRLERHLQDDGVGMVGPVTNAAPNEARIEVPYGTYGAFLAFAAARAELRAGHSFDISVLTMFCVAFRRSVYERIGGLDERFELGMFEDDDFAARLRRAGLRLVCADDVIVHHFGEASFGKLVPSGEHARIFAANRERYESKWGVAWQDHSGRVTDEYAHLVATVRAAIAIDVPAGSYVLVVSKGDDNLLNVPDRALRHFPCDTNGSYSGWYHESSSEVLAHLEQQIQSGATHLVFPESAAWWFDFYEGLEDRLRSTFVEAPPRDGCRIFTVRQPVSVDSGVSR